MRHLRRDDQDRFAIVHASAMSSPSSDFVSDVRAVVDAVLARWWIVASALVGAVLLAIAYIWATPPIFSSTVEILIDPRQQDVFDQKIVPGGMGTSSLGADTFLLDSQVEVLVSQTVLRQVIDRRNLLDDPEYQTGSRSGIVAGIMSMVKLLLRGPQAARIQPMGPYDKALDVLGENLHVWRKGNTYVLAVTVESEEPEKAAAIANTVADIYIEELQSLTRSKIREVEDLLGGRLAELRRAAFESQQAVETFRAENGLLATERLPVIEQRLRDLNQQLGIAATQTRMAQVRWEEVSRYEGQPAEVILASGTLDSSLLNSLREEFSRQAAREASLMATHGRRHPALQAVLDGKQAVQAEIRRETERLVGRHRVDYEVARANEETLRAQLSEIETATAASNQAMITLRELEREAEANAAIYQQFLNRSKDAREQVNLPTDAVRVISQAYPGSRPIWPKEPLLLALAGFVGLLGGLGLALLLHLFAAPHAGARPRSRSLLGEARA